MRHKFIEVSSSGTTVNHFLGIVLHNIVMEKLSIHMLILVSNRILFSGLLDMGNRRSLITSQSYNTSSTRSSGVQIFPSRIFWSAIFF